MFELEKKKTEMLYKTKMGFMLGQKYYIFIILVNNHKLVSVAVAARSKA